MKADAEWSKLGEIPGLVDGWTDVKDKVGIATEEFKASSPPFSVADLTCCARLLWLRHRFIGCRVDSPDVSCLQDVA